MWTDHHTVFQSKIFWALAICQSQWQRAGALLWWRANTQTVSFETLHGGQFTLINNLVDNTKIILFKGMDAYSGEVLIKVWAFVCIGNHMISSAIWDE